MLKFINWILRALGNGLINLVYAVTCALSFVMCSTFCYRVIFQPMAAAPGSRDSPALLLVGCVLLFVALIPTVILCSTAKKVLQAIFPNWVPAEFDDV